MTKKTTLVPQREIENDRPGCVVCAGWGIEWELRGAVRRDANTVEVVNPCRTKGSDHYGHMVSQHHPRCEKWWQPIGEKHEGVPCWRGYEKKQDRGTHE